MQLQQIYKKTGNIPEQSVFSYKTYFSPLIVFSFIVFFISLGDAIMSYTAPVFIEEFTNSSIIMGLILSFSSFAGIIIDFLIDENLSHKSYSYFLKASIFMTILFPLSFLVFKHSIPSFLIGMVCWGAYYEFRGYAMFDFINSRVDKSKHTQGWSTLNGYKAFAYFLGPLIATTALGYGYKFSFTAGLIAFLPAFLIYVLSRHMRHSFIKYGKREITVLKRSFLGQVGVLRTLMHRVWPLFLFSFMIIVVDSCFWTVGTLLSEQLKLTNQLGAYLIAAYMLPPIFSRWVTDRINISIGKKKTSFIYGLLAAMFLVAIGSTNSVPLIILYVFLMSLFINVALVLQSSVVEDFMDRLRPSGHGNDIVTLEQMSGSLGYILGPIVMGLLAYYIGYTQTFAVTGVLMGIISFICFIFVPLKIKLPQKELKELPL